jgi:hypothetical protein
VIGFGDLLTVLSEWGPCPADVPLANGSFETWDFTAWLPQDITGPFFPLVVGEAGISPWQDFFLSAPTDGQYAALTGFDGQGPGVIRLAQDVSVPGGSTTLEFDFRAAWDLLNFGAILDRRFLLRVQAPGGGPVLQESLLLVAPAGTLVNDTGDGFGAVDVTSFAGSDVRFSFEWEVPEFLTGPAFFQLDQVRLTAPCAADITGDGTVGFDDLLVVLSLWGPCE